jgi:hypothetical protein
MRKALLPALFSVFLILLSQQAFADDYTLNKVTQGEWKILDPSGQSVGTLKSIGDGAYNVQFSNGDYLGTIMKTGELRKPEKHPLFSESDAKFYLEVLKAIKKNK